MTQREALMPLAQGFGLMLVLYWVLASFMPIPAMLYDPEASLFVELLFLAGSAVTLFILVPVIWFMAKPTTPKLLKSWARSKSWGLTIYAAFWVTLYPILS